MYLTITTKQYYSWLLNISIGALFLSGKSQLASSIKILQSNLIELRLVKVKGDYPVSSNKPSILIIRGYTSEAGTIYPSGTPEFTPVFSGVRFVRSLRFFCVVFCRSLFVPLFFFFWTLCRLSFFDVRILINPSCL